MTAKQNERCAIQIEPSRSIKIVPEQNENHLNEQQHADYREYRWKFIQWMREIGKNPKKAEGYSDYTAYESAYRTARFDRWAWSKNGRYSIPPDPALVTEYIESESNLNDVRDEYPPQIINDCCNTPVIGLRYRTSIESK